MQINPECTIRSTHGTVYTYISQIVTLIGKKIMRVAGISWGPTGHSGEILHKAKGSSL